MQYTHKKNNALVRFIYLTLIGLGFILSFIRLQGYLQTLLMTVSLFAIIAGMFVFMKYEATTFSIVINAKETDFNFFINKVVGRRGAYTCYFFISDAVRIVKYNGKGTRRLLEQEYGKIGFYYYVHNIRPKDRYAIIFLLNGEYHAIVCEMNEECLKQIEEYMKLAEAVNERHKESPYYDDYEDEDASENAENVIEGVTEAKNTEVQAIAPNEAKTNACETEANSSEASENE